LTLKHVKLYTGLLAWLFVSYIYREFAVGGGCFFEYEFGN